MVTVGGSAWNLAMKLGPSCMRVSSEGIYRQSADDDGRMVLMLWLDAPD